MYLFTNEKYTSGGLKLPKPPTTCGGLGPEDLDRVPGMNIGDLHLPEDLWLFCMGKIWGNYQNMGK